MSPDILDNQQKETLERFISLTVIFGYQEHSDIANLKMLSCKFGAKIVLKWPLIPIIDQGPISRPFFWAVLCK